MNYRKRLNEVNEALERLSRDENLEDINNDEFLSIDQKKLPKGLSLIIPVYKGIGLLDGLIDCLIEQQIQSQNVEVIFILNGDQYSVDEDEEFIRTKCQQDGNLATRYKVLFSNPGASTARNVGIDYAHYSHVSFLDCDDFIHRNYIKRSLELINKCNDDTIIITHIYNVEQQNRLMYRLNNDEGQNVIQKDIQRFVGQKTTDYLSLSKVLSMNGAKIIPLSMIKSSKLRFHDELNSGEDVVFMMKLVVKNKPTLYICNQSDDLIYYRVIQDHSVSRRELSFEFNVTERRMVIHRLGKLLNIIDDTDLRYFIKNRMNAQASFINVYLKENPEDKHRVITDVEDLKQEYLPFEYINKGLANTLYIGYCFPPFVDTSGIVLAKRIRERKEIVDVISHDMYKVRDIDFNLNKIARPYIANHMILEGSTSFRQWDDIEGFVNRGLAKVKQNKKKYKKIYSRILWPASHFLAYKLKEQQKNIIWSAEFSDPSLYDTEHHIRYSKVTNQNFIKSLKKNVPRSWTSYIDDNMFNLAELIAFIYADQLVFTNINQKELMLNRIKESDLRHKIEQKSIVQGQPITEKELYSVSDIHFPLDNDYEHIAYFGAFYKNRSLEQLINNIYEHRAYLNINKKIKLHVFTNQSELHSLDEENINGMLISIYSYKNYFDFLSLLKQFNRLILTDTLTSDFYDKNPYLPSKLSDYLNSNTKIIAFVEQGSPLDQMNDQRIQKIKMRSK